MKIYTKKGDQGGTSLFGGQRVSKSSKRIDAYGTVDELNSVIGLIRAHKPQPRIEEMLHQLQNELFVLGADLATPPTKQAKIERISEALVECLEHWIDELDEQLEPLTYFILPTGEPAAATIHIARTVCRRAERAVVEAAETEEINHYAVHYLNRLSDLLFVMARFENAHSSFPESKWKVR